MKQSLTVLLFGNDARLLETRRWLLESTGCTVYAATQLLAFTHLLTDHPIDLAILCHSLSTEECELAKAAVHAQRPKAKVLIIKASSRSACETDGDGEVDSLDGPRTLLEMINHLIPAQLGSTGMTARVASV